MGYSFVVLSPTAAAGLVRLCQARLRSERTRERRGRRAEGGDGDGWRWRTEGTTVSSRSMWERQRGQCVWPGLLSSALPRSLHPRSCFSLGLFVLAGARRHLAATHSSLRARADAHAHAWQTRGCAFPAFVCFGSLQVPLTRTSKRQQSAKHTSMFTFTGAWTHTPYERKHDLPA